MRDFQHLTGTGRWGLVRQVSEEEQVVPALGRQGPSAVQGQGDTSQEAPGPQAARPGRASSAKVDRDGDLTWGQSSAPAFSLQPGAPGLTPGVSLALSLSAGLRSHTRGGRLPQPPAHPSSLGPWAGRRDRTNFFPVWRFLSLQQ